MLNRLYKQLSKRDLSIALIVLAASLGIGKASPPPLRPVSLPPSEISEIIGIKGEQLFESGDGEPGCLVNEISVPGQGLHASGSTGGMLLFDPAAPSFDPAAPSYGPPITPYAASAVGTGLGDLLAHLASNSQQPVVILVADDFNGAFTIPQGVFGLQHGDVGAEDELEAFQDAAPPDQLSHGSMVLNHINALILGAETHQFLAAVSDPASGSFVWENVQTATRLTVLAVDLATGSEIDTQTIADKLRIAIQESAGDSSARIVVNMSWVLLPCKVLDDFDPTLFSTFNAYVAALASVNPGLSSTDPINDLFKLTTWVGDDDPLHQLIRRVSCGCDTPSSDDVVFVASTGNFSLDYSMLPAAWGSVVGVGAFNGPPDFSNKGGDRIERGAWFTLTDPGDFNELGTNSEVAYAGTSFSTPAVSLLTALDIAR